jgi:hypothetical protein
LYSRTTFDIEQSSPTTLTIMIHSVLGDALLSSAVWLAGSDLNAMDVYDTVLVSVEASTTIISTPAVRVLSGVTLTTRLSKLNTDPENPKPKFQFTKGLPNAGTGITWYYWIPCSDGRWLQMQTEDMKILGRRPAQVMTSQEVTTRLGLKDMYISLNTLDDIVDALKTSREVALIWKNYCHNVSMSSKCLYWSATESSRLLERTNL